MGFGWQEPFSVVKPENVWTDKPFPPLSYFSPYRHCIEMSPTYLRYPKNVNSVNPLTSLQMSFPSSYICITFNGHLWAGVKYVRLQEPNFSEGLKAAI